MPQNPGRPSKLVFHALTVLAVLACVLAARWQWQRAHRTADDAVPEVAAIEWSAFNPQDSYSGQRVRVTGRYLPGQVLVSPRERNDQTGAWVYSALVPDGQPASDAQPGSEPVAAIGIIRGWVPQGGSAAQLAPPAGEVDVTGILVADERRPGTVADQTADGLATMGRVDSAALAEVAGRRVRAGWVALVESSAGATGQPMPLEVSELPGAEVGLNWRNAAYAVQWLIFAAFAVFFWNRFRRDYFGASSADSEDEGQEART